MNFQEAIERAIQEPTLVKALTWICGWECDRAIDQARFRYGSGANGAGWDTCFELCINEVMLTYGTQHPSEEL
jgi:hypothetical protein